MVFPSLNHSPLSINNLQNEEQCSLAESLNRAQTLIGEKTGIIQKVEFEKLRAGEPSVFFARSFPSNLFPLAGQKAINNGDAASVNPQRALMKAIGESIERYCSAHFEDSAFLFGKARDFTTDVVNPKDFALFSESQYSQSDFPFVPFTDDTVLIWAKGHSLVSDRPTYVPAQFVYVPYDFGNRKEPILHIPISTGLACSSNLQTAICKSIYEVIERDAFMIIWKNQIPCPKINLTNVQDPFAQELLKALIDVPVSTEARLIDMNLGVYVVVFIITSANGTLPHTIMGLGAGINPEKALTLAIEEAYLTFLGMSRYVEKFPDFRPKQDHSDIDTPTKHALAHAVVPSLKRSLRFLTGNDSQVSLTDLGKNSHNTPLQNLETLISIAKKNHLDIILFDLTTPDINDAGFKVVRAVIPGMSPLDVNHSQRYLGGKRLYQVPCELGFLDKPKTEKQLNPFPHPFP